MTLALRITWPERRYDAATTDPEVPEWPPAPARIFAALRASAQTNSDLAALRWLENQPPPSILAERDPLAQRRENAYVVVNSVDKKGGNLTHPGRTNNLRVRTGTTLRDGTATMLWSDATPREDTIGALERLAANVPYVGRTTSPAVVDVLTDVPRSTPSFVPSTFTDADVDLPVPFPGLLTELDDLYATGGRSHEAYRDRRPYRYDDGTKPRQPTEEVAIPATYPTVLTFRLAPDTYLPGQLTGVLTAALRRAVLSVVDDPIPPVLSGHGLDGRPHTAYLVFPHVGNQYADGHVLALAIAVPAGHPEAEAALPKIAGITSLRVPGMGDLTLSRRTAFGGPFGASVDRWIGPARTWTSATPMLLDRFPRRALSVEQVVADGVERAGYPRPALVETGTTPFFAGAVTVRRHQLPLRDGDRRPTRHVRLTFDQPVTGPVLVGALRHLGLGLCAPERS
jgi:CRISPR-associated protein Csb2